MPVGDFVDCLDDWSRRSLQFAGSVFTGCNAASSISVDGRNWHDDRSLPREDLRGRRSERHVWMYMDPAFLQRLS